MLSVPRAGLRRCTAVASTSLRSRPSSARLGIQMRFISSNDIFNTTQASMDIKSFSIPDVPVPPLPAPSLEQLLESGESVLSELGLFQWYKPSSYFRVALEGIHQYTDIPWWGTIVVATIMLRLALIAVPVMSQRLVAKQSQYRTELNEFRQRIDDARKESNSLMQQQILLEQRDFLKSKDIRLGRQFLIMMANGGVFMTQFFAIKKMIVMNYPGFDTGGTLWFTDLTACDPYYALPMISAATMCLVMKLGVETGTSMEQFSPMMRAGMLYGMPTVIFIASSQFASGLCVYWCASNIVSLAYAVAFKTQPVRKLFKIPAVIPAPKSDKNVFKEAYSAYKANKVIPPSFSQLKDQDAQQFRKAGRAKPILKSENE